MAQPEVLEEIYYPDATVTSTTAREICARLSRFCTRMDFINGKLYAASLSDEVLCDIHVAKDVVSLYAQDADYNGARMMLQRLHLTERLASPDALLNGNIAVLALMSAWVECAADLRMNEALALVEEIDQMYMSRDREHIVPRSRPEYASSSGSADRDRQPATVNEEIECILQQRELWELDDPTAYDDSIYPITNARIEIEEVSLHILLRARDVCMYSNADLDRRLRQRLPPIIEYLASRRRRLKYAFVMCIWLPVLHWSVATSIRFQDYLETLVHPHESLIRAIVLCKLVGYLEYSDMNAVTEHSEQAASIFARQDCLAHLAILTLECWRARKKLELAGHGFGSRTNNALVDSDSVEVEQAGDMAISESKRVQETLAKHLLHALLNIHQTLVECRNTPLQVECIIEAVALAKQHPSLWRRVEGLLEPTLSQLTERDDVWNAQRLQCRYYLELGEVYHGAEEARIFFEKLLAKEATAVIPDHFLAACTGLWRAYTKMSDHEKALEYALQDFKHPFCVQNEARRSDAVYRVAWSRFKSVEGRTSQRPLDKAVLSASKRELDEVIVLLEFWINLDQQASRAGALRDKSRCLHSTLWLVVHSLKLDKYEDLWKKQPSIFVDHNESRVSVESLYPVLQMVRERRFNDALQLCDGLHQKILKDEGISLEIAHQTVTAVAMLLHATATTGDLLDQDTRKLMLSRQYDLITSDLQALKLATSESFVVRATPLMWTYIECVKTWPERKAEYVQEITQYFEQAYELSARTSRHIMSRTGVQTWLRKRTLGSSFNFSKVSMVATEFFLRCELYDTAWTWIQRGRAPALRDVLTDRINTRQRLAMSMESTADISKTLMEERRLRACVDDADPAHYFDAVRRWSRYQASMHELPLLQALLSGPTQSETLQLDKIDEIWALKEFLPKQCNIVLVDWFIDSRNVIWRLDVNYEQRNGGPRFTWGYIQTKKLEDWRHHFLRFPPGEVSPLEGRMKALHQLRPLFTGLQVICKPGDLLVLSMPGELSGIPIHGIPFEGRVMIERNPVVYSGGLSLLRQCLKRASNRTQPHATSLLQDAAFMSAYEQGGYEAERTAIFAHLEQTADCFGATKLLGNDLSVDAFQAAMKTKSWIHYHGHAYHAKTEALNQCLVLGRLSDEEREAQSLSVDEMRERLATEMPFEAPLTDREAILSTHMLEGTSRLTVSDIFAMDLSTTSPVIMSIACDSGVQEFSPSNDPLGLVPALFCAGASSIVGTLWPIRSVSGRMFSEAFYKSLVSDESKSAHGARHCINLAIAFRDAVLAVKKSREDPYSWAAFTLQGAPFYFYTNDNSNTDPIDEYSKP